MTRFRAALLSAATLSAATPAASVAASYAYARPEGRAVAMQQDLDACTVRGSERAAVARATHRTPVVVTGGLAGLLAVALVDGVAQGVHTERERERGVDACMRARAWTRLELSEGEAAALKAAGGNAEARGRWFDGFYASPELTPRLAAAEALATPALPTLPSEPLVFGPARLDPASLRADDGVVQKGGVLVRGVATHRATGVLAKPFEAQFLGYRSLAPAGTPVFAVEDRIDPDAEDGVSSYWCFRHANKMTSQSRGVMCAASTPEAYQVFGAGKLDWAVPVDRPPQPLMLRNTAIVVTRTDADALGPMDFEMKLVGVDARMARLEAAVSRNGERVVLWRGAARFSSEGRAVLPFWSARLLLARDGKGVRATWATDGDGQGWTAAKAD